MRSGKYFITINEHDDFTIFRTENKVLFEALSCAGDKEKMKASMKNHPEWYQNLDKDSAAAISGIVGIKIDIKTIKEGKRYNMCKAFDDYKEGREEGRLEGRLEQKRLNLEKLMKNLKISLEQAMSILEIPEEEKGCYMSLEN